MFTIRINDKNDIVLAGRFDASMEEKAKKFFSKIDASHTVDFKDLTYISSLGLGILIGTQKRLNETGHQLILAYMNPHIRDIFRYAGFDLVFKIQ